MDINKVPIKGCVNLFMMCSYQYYHRFTSLIEDTEYDMLCKRLSEQWDDWQTHQHAHLITKEDLKAGTLFSVKAVHYPSVVVAASEMWADGMEEA